MEKETKKKTTTKKTTTTKKANSAKKTVASGTKKTVTKKTATTKKTTATGTKKNTSKNVTAAKKSNAVKKNNVQTKKIEKTEPIVEKVIEEKKEAINIDKNEKFSLNNNEFTKLIKIILIVTAGLLLLYFITYFVLNKDGKEKSDEKQAATIQYEEIIASKLLSQNVSEYYVLVYDSEDKYLTTYDTYLSVYKYLENSKKVYKLNFNLGFNSGLKSETNNFYVNNSNEFKTSTTTLVKVSNGNVVEAYQGKDSIISHLKEISK